MGKGREGAQRAQKSFDFNQLYNSAQRCIEAQLNGELINSSSAISLLDLYIQYSAIQPSQTK